MNDSLTEYTPLGVWDVSLASSDRYRPLPSRHLIGHHHQYSDKKSLGILLIMLKKVLLEIDTAFVSFI